MESNWSNVLNASLPIYLAIAIGAGARWLGWLTEEADHSLMRLVIRVLVPCLIFSVVANNAAFRDLNNITLPPVVGLVTMALGLGVAWAVAQLSRRLHGLDTPPERRTFAFCVAIYNYGFIPLPLVKALFNDATLGVLFVHNVGCELAIWTLGVMVLAGTLGKRWWEGVLNPPSLTIFVALTVNLLGWGAHIPDFAMNTFRLLGDASVPIALVLVGAIVADELQTRDPNRRPADSFKLVFWSLLLRLGLLPAAFLLLAWLLPCSVELKRVVVIQAAMPCGTFPIVMARHYGGEPGVALRVVLGTSLASLLTIPMWLTLGMRIVAGG